MKINKNGKAFFIVATFAQWLLKLAPQKWPLSKVPPYLFVYLFYFIVNKTTDKTLYIIKIFSKNVNRCQVPTIKQSLTRNIKI